MKKGTIKWFNKKKGFGFISLERGQTDVFVHHSDIKASDLESLEEGNIVEFKIIDTTRGPQAEEVVKL